MKTMLLVTVCLLAASCHSQNNPLGADEYVPFVHGDQLFLFNSRTGEAYLLKDGQRHQVPLYDPSVEELLSEFNGHIVRFEQDAGNPSILKITGISKTIAEQPKVRVAFTPYIESLRGLSGTILWLQFVDSDGFQISREAISASDLTRNVDGAGGYLGFSVQKDLGMAPEQYGYVSSVNVLWSTELEDALSAWLETDLGRKWQESQNSTPTADQTTSDQ